MEIDYSKVSKNIRVVALIKERERIEKEINALDSKALLKYELEALQSINNF